VRPFSRFTSVVGQQHGDRAGRPRFAQGASAARRASASGRFTAARQPGAARITEMSPSTSCDPFRSPTVA
jgi:hypothetical protein